MGSRMDTNVGSLSDDELREKLENFGVTAGVISSSTRTLYERLLLRKTIGPTIIHEEGTSNSVENSLSREFNNPEPVIQHKIMEANIYYGVFIPEELRNPEVDKGIVCTDTASCVTTIKKYPGSRFKGFSDYENALQFSINGSSSLKVVTAPQSCVGEKNSVFRGPKSQDLIKFRSAIEKGDKQFVNECIEGNPRYLVSGCDAPTILHEGFRYNALHVSCRTNQSSICFKILEVVSSPGLFQRLYPDEDMEMSVIGSRRLLDLYLNTPDKGFNDTALHFACKHGFIDCVRILLSYVDCDKERRNKYDESPFEVICSRAKNSFCSTKPEIAAIFEDQFYVPVYRDEDNCLAPTIGSPFSLDSNQSPVSQRSSPPSLGSSPITISPMLKVRGFAGPMSPQKADLFYSRWKKTSVPSSSPKGKAAIIRIEDHEKGLERVGRDLAVELNVNWKEYWDFLNNFENLSSPDGLRILEDYLRKKHWQILQERNLEDSIESAYANQSDVLKELGSCEEEEVESFETSFSSCSSTRDIREALESLRLNVSLSPRRTSPASQGSQVTVKTDPPLYDTYLNNNTLSCSGIDLNASVDVNGQSLSSFYNYTLRSAQICASKITEALKDFSFSVQDSYPPDTSLFRTFLRCDLCPEIICFRKVIRNARRSTLCKDIEVDYLHVVLAAEISTSLMMDLPTDELFKLGEVFKSPSSSESLNYLKIEDDEIFQDVTDDERKDIILHLRCVFYKLTEALHIAYDLIKTQDEEKIDLNLLSKCSCQWTVAYDKIKDCSSSMRNRAIDSSLIRSVGSSNCKSQDGDTSLVRRATTALRKFLFGEAHPTSTTPSDVVKHLSFEDDDVLSESASFATAASSFDEEDGMRTPPEAIEVYIFGKQPSKTDLDVLNAIKDIDVKESTYPYINHWRSLIECAPREAQNSWASPCCRRRNTPRSLEFSGLSKGLCFKITEESLSESSLKKVLLSELNNPDL